MTLTPEERRDVNRENARKSTGPRSEAGKARARFNAMKHGLRAETLPLPGEDPAVAAARAEAWNDYYRPASPAAQHLVNECARATLLADRVHARYHAAVTRQVRHADEDAFRARFDEVEGLKELLRKDPPRALNGLCRSTLGLDYLLGRWEVLETALRTNGRWEADELCEALRILGFTDRLDRTITCPPAWATRVLNLLCGKDPAPEAVQQLYRRDIAPASLSKFYLENEPDPGEAHASLLAMVGEEVTRLKAERERIGTELEDPDDAEAQARALTLNDPTEARLFLRYHAEARNTFHRNYAALVKTLEHDAAGDEDGEVEHGVPATADAPSEGPGSVAEIDSPNEANDPGETSPAAEADSPNEASDRPVPDSDPSEHPAYPALLEACTESPRRSRRAKSVDAVPA